MSDEARERVEALRARSPDAVRLACCVSAAARVEPELARRMRLALLPEVEAGVEADLWLSELVEAANPVAMVLDPGACDLLRQELAGDPALLERAQEVVREVHRDAPPLVRAEEEITYLSLSRHPDAPARIERLLESVLAALLREERVGVVHWAARALPRLPAPARESDASWRLAIGAGARLGGRKILRGEVPAGAGEWLRRVLPPEVPRAQLGVRLLEGALEIGRPRAGADALEAPRMLPLHLSWGEGEGKGSAQVSVEPERVQLVAVGPGPVRIRTLLGDEFELRPLPPHVAKVFTIEVLQARHGESFLLHYGDASDPKLVLIDGGPPGTFQTVLQSRLAELKKRRSPDYPLPIRLVVVSHPDDDRISGILDLSESLLRAKQGGKPLPYAIRTLWHHPADKLLSRRLLENVVKLGIHLNRTLATNRPWVPYGTTDHVSDGLYFHLIGPLPERDRPSPPYGETVVRGKTAASEPSRAPGETAYTDNSESNLSSIVVMAEIEGRRILLTGDARGDHVLQGLEQGGFLDPEGRIHVDVLKVPNGGSARSVGPDFFERITADHYVICADGRRGLPDVEALRALSGARGDATYTLYLTAPVPHALAFLEDDSKTKRYRTEILEPNSPSLFIDLLSPFIG